MRGVELHSHGDGAATLLAGGNIHRLDRAQVKELVTVIRLRGRGGYEFKERLERWLAVGEHPLDPILRPSLYGPCDRL
jgi:hypothetical protein